jgi:hypothetical protein
VSETLLYLAASYYWPLLDEVKPKLGKYTPAVDAARDIAEILFREAARSTKTSVLLHRHIVMQYAKPFEILEYAGFLAKREASRAMKSGGRGARYAVNLCSLLEQLSGSRLTSDLFDRWLTEKSDPAEIHERSDHFRNVKVPLPNADADLAILDEDIDILKRSDAYPYGLTDNKIKHLKDAGFLKIRDLAVALDSELLEAKSVGPHAVKTIRSTVAQAVWM